MDSVKKAITSQFPVLSLPLLIPVLIAEVTAETVMGKLSAIHAELAKIEVNTGFGDWRSRPEEDISHKDYRKIWLDLAALDNRFAFLDVAVGSTLMVTQFTIQEIQSMKNYISPAKFRQLGSMVAHLSDRAEVLSSNLKHMQRFGGLSQRMRAQQNVVSSAETSTPHSGEFLLICSRYSA
jgi:hypothetical protein